jgi:hypothetical protein
MGPLNFKKERAEHFLHCLATGEPIGKVHTTDEMAALGGACFFALTSRGPMLRKAAIEMRGGTFEEPTSREHKEADDEMVCNDVHAILEFAGHLTMLVQDGEYLAFRRFWRHETRLIRGDSALIAQFRREPLARGHKAKFALWWEPAKNRGNRSVLAIVWLSLGRETCERPVNMTSSSSHLSSASCRARSGTEQSFR